MKIYLVIRKVPDRDIEIDAFHVRPKASAYVTAIVRDFARDGVELKREDDLWVGQAGRLSVEIEEVPVR